MSSWEHLIFSLEGGVAKITLNRPDALNAFNDKMIRELQKALKQCAKDKEVRVIVLSGAGRAFSSGQDLKDVQAREESISIGEHLRHGYNKIISQMRSLEKPIIGAINGVAAGAGMSIALATDIRIASEKASFLQAFVKVGLVPDSGSTWVLPRLIGPAKAFELMATGDKIPASQALEMGLVNQVVALDEFPEVVDKMAQRFANSPRSVGLIKRAMNKAFDNTLEESLEYEAFLQEVAARTSDHKEGLSAFIEKREAKFEGK